MNKQNQKNKFIYIYVFVLLSILLISLRKYILSNFKLVTFEQLLYSTINTEGASASSITDGVKYIFIHVFFGIIIFSLFIFLNKKYKKNLSIKLNFNYNKKVNKQIILFPCKFHIKTYLIIFIISLIYFLNGIGFFGYIKNRFTDSSFYEKNYVHPNDIKITFPEKKQNLIYIFLESMENSVLSKENGGTVEKSYTPELEELALNNINFSHNNKIGGPFQVNNTGWTIAAMVAHTSGVTLNTMNIDGNYYGSFSKFLPGVKSIGDILSENGYINYFMLGSDSKYGGRKDYFGQHGHYYIYDYYTAVEKNKFNNYYVWWGYEDKKLFEYAKEELLKLSDGAQPFNFTMLTVDTHFTDGYLDETCERPFDSRYANVFNCSSNMVYEFITWIQEQDFYENTTIVLVGDHLTMQSNFFDESNNYQRTTYNTFINSRIDTEYNKNREFSTLDMFPTTLASLGVELEGDRLGLGTNLFSGKKTLIEKYGLDYVNKEVLKSSEFYNNNLLGESYYEILEKNKEEKDGK